MCTASSRLRSLACRALAAIVLTGCGSVHVTPDSVRASAAPRDLRERIDARWRDAVRLVNEFLASEYNLSLPRGRVDLDDEEGMRLQAGSVSMPVQVHCCCLGDLVLRLGGEAASLVSGFVVGRRGPAGGDRGVSNSLFLDDRSGLREPGRIASMILHETAHLVHDRGFLRNCGFAAEAIFLWRCRYNSVEDRPRAVSVELHFFKRARKVGEYAGCPETPAEARLAFALHLLRSRGSHEEHGPFPESAGEADRGASLEELRRLRACVDLARSWLADAEFCDLTARLFRHYLPGREDPAAAARLIDELAGTLEQASRRGSRGRGGATETPP